MDPDSDPDSAIFVIDLQDGNKKLIKKFCLLQYRYFLKVRGVLGNKFAGQHNLKTIHFKESIV